mmetsp:Transcript_99668/g.287731  ORF Transcript_99668/g.287731 Transcript_99668/m.287731 type:complete len:599 (-) Transcript_99668:301-2097(-)
MAASDRTMRHLPVVEEAPKLNDDGFEHVPRVVNIPSVVPPAPGPELLVSDSDSDNAGDRSAEAASSPSPRSSPSGSGGTRGGKGGKKRSEWSKKLFAPEKQVEMPATGGEDVDRKVLPDDFWPDPGPSDVPLPIPLPLPDYRFEEPDMDHLEPEPDIDPFEARRTLTRLRDKTQGTPESKREHRIASDFGVPEDTLKMMEKDKPAETRPARRKLEITPEMDDLFLEFGHYSVFSRFSGLYSKVSGETRYGQPVWRRRGVARQRARLYLDFDVDRESWGFVAELEGDSRPGFLKATVRADDPEPEEPSQNEDESLYFMPGPPVANGGGTGYLSVAQPKFPDRFAITTRVSKSGYSDGKGETGSLDSKPAVFTGPDDENTQYNGVYELQEGEYIEGMPVYKSTSNNTRLDRWLFSSAGRWRLKSASQTASIRNLAQSGFFWLPVFDHSSMLHGGTSLFGPWEADPVYQRWTIFSHPDTAKGRRDASRNVTTVLPPNMQPPKPFPLQDQRPDQEEGSGVDQSSGGGCSSCQQRKKQQQQQQRPGVPMALAGVPAAVAGPLTIRRFPRQRFIVRIKRYIRYILPTAHYATSAVVLAPRYRGR